MLFKLLFVFAFVLSTFTGKEIEINGEHNLSAVNTNFVAVDNISIPDLDLDNPFAVDSVNAGGVSGYDSLTVSGYSEPLLPLQHFENSQSRAPPILYT